MVDIVIDGSLGEGGGQIFRTSLTLAMCLKKSIRITNIRAGRKKSGLLRQHLACLSAAVQISQGRVTGDELGSREVTFYPGEVQSGHYTFSVGSAGSTTLIFQTILLPLLFADNKSTVNFEGGTHNPMAPSYNFLKESYLASLNMMGARVDTYIEKFGFAPAGGGQWRCNITPSKLKYFKAVDRVLTGENKAVAQSSKVTATVNERELCEIKKYLHWPEDQLESIHVSSDGSGNCLCVRIGHDAGCSVFESLGERRLSAEKVAQRVLKDVDQYLQGRAVMEEYLTDQLLLPMVLGQGGEFTTSCLSLHTRTNIDVIKMFLPIDININKMENNEYKIIVNNSVAVGLLPSTHSTGALHRYIEENQ